MTEKMTRQKKGTVEKNVSDNWTSGRLQHITINYKMSQLVAMT